MIKKKEKKKKKRKTLKTLKQESNFAFEASNSTTSNSATFESTVTQLPNFLSFPAQA